jgi:hypothetical protein
MNAGIIHLADMQYSTSPSKTQLPDYHKITN